MAIEYRRNLAIALALAAATPWIIGAAGNLGDTPQNNTIISIVGTGSTPQQAKLITINAGVQSFGVRASDAMRENADAMARIRTELGRNGIEPKDIRTQGMQLSPGTQYDKHESIKGYNVSHNLSVVFRDIGKSGAVLDTLVNAGANQINGPRFSTEADDHTGEIARTEAIRDANQRAQYYAKNLGLRVKRVVSMRDSTGYASGQPAAARLTDVGPGGGGTAIAEGEDIVRVSVYAEYELVK